MIEASVGQPEIPKTDVATTATALAKLRHFGVTEQDLKNEVFQGFLPAPVDGQWSAVAVKRAKRLYRLRAKGAKGKSLKLLLFLADGWGWEGVRDFCATGAERIALLSLNGVERYARAKGDLSFSVDDIADWQHRALVRRIGDRPGLKPTSTETTAFYVGLLYDGTPLEGGTCRRIIEPVLRAIIPEVPDPIVDYVVKGFDLVAGALDLRIARQVERILAATPEQVERARQKLHVHIYFIRTLIKRLGGQEAKGTSLNMLTFFGHASEMGAVHWSQGDVKLSRSLIFAGVVGGFIALDIAFEQFLNRLPSWLSELLRVVLE